MIAREEVTESYYKRMHFSFRPRRFLRLVESAQNSFLKDFFVGVPLRAISALITPIYQEVSAVRLAQTSIIASTIRTYTYAICFPFI